MSQCLIQKYFIIIIIQLLVLLEHLPGTVVLVLPTVALVLASRSYITYIYLNFIPGYSGAVAGRGKRLLMILLKNLCNLDGDTHNQSSKAENKLERPP